MTAKVERGIPIPEIRSNRKYPWNELTEVGLSFFVPVEGEEEKHRIFNSIKSATRDHRPQRFTIRIIEDGIRVWRVE